MISVPGPTREPAIGALALVVLAGSVGGAAATATAGGWWWILFFVLVLLAATCAYGAVDSFQLKDRAEP